MKRGEASSKLWEEISKWEENKLSIWPSDRRGRSFYEKSLVENINKEYLEGGNRRRTGDGVRRRVAVYLPETKRWVAAAVEIENGKAYISKRSVIIKGILPKAFNGNLNVVGSDGDGFGNSWIGGRCNIVKNGTRVLEGQWFTPAERYLETNELQKCYLGDTGKDEMVGKCRLIGAFSDGKQLFGVWRKNKGIGYSYLNSFFDFKKGEVKEEGEIKWRGVPSLASESLSALTEQVRSESARREISNILKGLPKIAGQNKYEYFYGKSQFLPEQIEGFSQKEPVGFFKVEGHLEDALIFWISLIKRGKKIFVPVLVEDLPANFLGQGILDLEGSHKGDLGIFCDYNNHMILNAKVLANKPTPNVDVRIRYTPQNISSCVLPTDKIDFILLVGGMLWALWENEEGEKLGFERVYGLREVRKGGYLYGIGRNRIIQQPPGIHKLETLLKEITRAGISL